MEISASITASLQGRYAAALFDLAGEAGVTAAVEKDLETLGAALHENDDLAGLIRNPRITRAQAASAMAAVAGVLGLHEITTKFLGVLAQNRRLVALPEILRAFATIAAAQRGEIAASVTSAHALSDEQIAELAEKLRVREGKVVKLSAKVDPELLGGLVVRIGSRQIDSSIRTRLNLLAQTIKG